MASGALGKDELQAVLRRILAWRADPVLFVRENFKIRPDKWQERALRYLARKDIKKYRLSMQACAGPGKSAVLAWAGLWMLSCFGGPNAHPQGLCVSMSKDNLLSGLWKEMSRWGNVSPFLTSQFVFGARRIHHKDPKKAKTWFLEVRTWSKSATPEEQGESLSGIHGPYLFYLIDEGGSIPPIVGLRAEQGMSDPNGLAWIVTAGNPMSKDSFLYEACIDERFETIEITADPEDPDRTPRVDPEYARHHIEKRGRTDPWVEVFILGKFPETALNQLLSLEEIDAAMGRDPLDDGWTEEANVISLDVAGEGVDRNIAMRRQGPVAFMPVDLGAKRRGRDVARDFATLWKKHKCDAGFVDNTGGYGRAVIEALEVLRYKCIPVTYSERDSDPGMVNLRAGNWWRMAEWIKDGGCLPKHQALRQELASPTYTFRGNRLLLEPKDSIVARLGRSPDNGDSLSQTFTVEVVPGIHDLERAARQLSNRNRSLRRGPFREILDDYR